jgi:hypothetical protein
MMPNMLVLAASDQATSGSTIRANGLLRDVGALGANPTDEIMSVLSHLKAMNLARKGPRARHLRQ